MLFVYILQFLVYPRQTIISDPVQYIDPAAWVSTGAFLSLDKKSRMSLREKFSFTAARSTSFHLPFCRSLKIMV